MKVIASMPSGSVASSDYVSSAEALAVLAVKPQTLYSYVSRGWVRRIRTDSKTSRYNRDDIHRLKSRSIARSGHGAVAASALQWGEPVLVTGITEFTENGPRYRERLALDLAREGYSFESVAEYLWKAHAINSAVRWRFDPSIARIVPRVTALAGAYPGIHLRQLLTEIVLLHGIEYHQACRDSGHLPLANLARALIQALCMAFGFVGRHKRYVRPVEGESIARYILRSYGLNAGRLQTRVLNSVLVLLADHEFSSPTFAARIAASNKVDLHSCVGAALQVHFGSNLGLRCESIELALNAAISGSAPSAVPAQIEASPVGFDLPLYIKGDPRAAEILRLASGLKENAAATRRAIDALQCIDNHRGAVSLDAALVVLCRALGMEGPIAAGLLVVSRSAGWIAHINEQRQQGFLIRPRGKFQSTESPDD